MHLHYYGTAAAEGIPGLFCTCPTCQASRAAGGRNLRTRSQALVDGKLLLDFPPDTHAHCLFGGLELPPITACLLTHSHTDHLYAEDFWARSPGIAHAGAVDVPLSAPLRIYAAGAALKTVRAHDEEELEARRVIELHEVRPFEPFAVDDFEVTALTANHSQAHGAVFYSIARAGKRMLYANDTGYFPPESWDYLEQTRPYFDLVSLDCTGAARSDYRDGHMGLPVNAEVRARLEALGCAGAHTVFCAHHFSHNGGLTYDELVPAAAAYGFLVSYDGMELHV